MGVAVLTMVMTSALVAAPAAATAPGPVRSIGILAGPGYLTASWVPPATDGGAPISNYSVVAVHPSGNVAAWTNLLSDSTSASVAGLMNGVRYTVHVLAWNADGSSAASKQGIPRAGGRAPTVPPRPRELQVTFAQSGFHGITARWTAPPSDGGAPISAYSMVMQYGRPPFLTTRWVNVGPHERQAVCADCDANVVQVFAWNVHGPGEIAFFGQFPP